MQDSEFEQKVVWTHTTHEGKVEFVFEGYQMSTAEFFHKWVQFMNAIGYVLDPVEMENMWNGVQ